MCRQASRTSNLFLWGEILPEIEKTQKYLQSKGLGLDQSVVAVQSLQSFLLSEREKMVENVITCARALCDNLNIPVVRRVRRKRRMDDEKTIDFGHQLMMKYDGI